MVAPAQRKGTWVIRPLTPARWGDLERLFGDRGACGGCWCMWWRLPHAQWQQQRGDLNRAALRAVVEAGPPPGLLAYAGGEPVGWCALAPRAHYPRLAGSRVLRSVDDQPVWSITCFFVAKSQRGRGLMAALLGAAADYARRKRARILEGYPMEPKGPQAAVFLYPGVVSAFRKAGFVEVARRSPSRPIMRRVLGQRDPRTAT